MPLLIWRKYSGVWFWSDNSCVRVLLLFNKNMSGKHKNIGTSFKDMFAKKFHQRFTKNISLYGVKINN